MIGNLKMYAVGTVAVGVVGYIGYLQSVATERKHVIETVQTELAGTRHAFKEVTRHATDDIRRRELLEESLAEASNEVAQLEKVFANHDLAKLLREKPALVSRRLNAGTQRLFQSVEEATRD